MQRYKILKYQWHTGHDYELSKLNHDFYYLTSTYRKWSTQQRPIPQNISWVSHHQQAKADVMILHLDQWSFYEPSKRYLFLHHKASFDGPKIVIIHGCNLADGCSQAEMAELTDGCFVVCNSYTAETLWNLPRSRTILHGFSPEEWPQTSYEEKTPVVTVPYRERWKKTVNRDFIDTIEKSSSLHWIGRDYHFSSLTDYQNFLSSHSIFINPSHASANPRARAEAMLMGLAIITTASHREDTYIENGVNGFASDDEDELLSFLLELQDNRERQREIGKAGQKTAQKFFHIDRFKTEWDNLLNEAISS